VTGYVSKRAIAGLLATVWLGAGIPAFPQGIKDPIPEADDIKAPKEDSGSSPHNLTEGFLAGMRTPIAFSLGLYELYAPNLSNSADKSPVFTMARPRLFASTATKNSRLQLDYTFGYRRYNRRPEIHSSDHSATLNYDYRLSRSATLQISDSFRSALNDNGVLPSSSLPAMYQSGFAQEFYAPNERTTTNSVVTSLNYHAGKRTNLTVFGSYDMWRYSASSFGNAQGFQVGIRGEHQINKWFFLSSNYSHYLTAVEQRFETASIHRLQLGGFKFKLGRTTQLYFSGGADYTRFQGHQWPTASYQAGFSKTTGSTLVSIVYNRGLSSAVGPQGTLNGHVVGASFTQWLSRRVSVQVTPGYTRGASFKKNSRVEYLAGNAEVQIEVQRHVMFSIQGSYISQRGTNLASETPALSRYTVSTGVQFFMSTLDGRKRTRR